MKIVLTAGGTGGHFYPLIAIAEAIKAVCAERNLIVPTIYYLADKPYDEAVLFANDIIYLASPAGKMRRYASFSNFTDMFVTAWGTLKCFFLLLKIYPDVVISKGGYASVPTTLAAGLLRLPLIIHESDAKPGRANLLAAKAATRIGIAFESAIEGFPEKVRGKIAKVGIPVRTELMNLPEKMGAKAALGLDPTLPTVLIMGGSQGSLRINETVLDALPDIVSFANVIHQTGKDHFESVSQTASVILEKAGNTGRYHPFAYLNADTMRNAASAADVVIARAGSTTITELAIWGKPAVLIPIPEAVSHDQRANAYAYAHTGAAVVLEEANLTPHVLASEARRLGTTPELASKMTLAAKGFANPDAARLIAEEAIRIALTHENK
ncbi:MAG: UDP-N-acetylglucosamine--N-acetylmuramyl-(pentapeptide) pyrophosphoryl-undecaprenol N-acetylglucosam [Parcubacteria bacterium C7867-004]|nr:MAG: UDP-N-acetylglucosamine--N-acetylmuramyl-(pentapeptide) pyrophosphoryl-undecaprenol N-acetylglucosam [Parcubacteria bacterium C7867-004]